jgi:catechol 2,3-dioxygenase
VPELPADAHIGEVHLTVSNLDRSVSFYTETLGFRLLQRDGQAAVLGASGDRPLMWLHGRPGAPAKPRRSSGLYHVAIVTPSRAALGRSLRRLAERRYPLSGAADHLVSEALYLSDPDGLGLEIYRDRPRESWSREDGEVLMATDPLDLDAIVREPGAERPWTGLDAETTIGHVHLHVPSLETAEAFYCGEVGFAPTLRRYPGALFVAAGGYHHHLGLNIWAGAGAPPPPKDAVGLTRFTIEAGAITPRELEHAESGVTVELKPAA